MPEAAAGLSCQGVVALSLICGREMKYSPASCQPAWGNAAITAARLASTSKPQKWKLPCSPRSNWRS